MNIRAKILEFNRRDIRGNSILNLNLNKTLDKIERKKVFVYRGFNCSKPVGIVNNIDIVDNSLYVDIKLLDSIDLSDLIFAFGGEGSRKEIDEKNSDFVDMVMTNVGLIDKGDEVPYV